MDHSGLLGLDFKQKYTYADYLLWTFDETVELIKGRIFPMAAPLSNHQIVTGNVYEIFKKLLKNKACRTFIAPFDVRLPKPLSQRKSDSDIETVVQPDVCIICDLKKIDRRGCLGAPDLIVEVLSKSTTTKDIKDKFEVYEESGVREYWIVGVEDRIVHVWRLDESGKYVPDQRPYVTGDTVRANIFDNFTMEVAEIFEQVIDFDD
jgi:Uma2 family endonuclease